MSRKVLAIDLGASSGRAIIGEYDGKAISLQEIHRFPNDPVRLGGTLYWDILRLMHEIRLALRKAKDYDISGIGIDTWGVDFGLLDGQGRLLANPVHYRDTRTQGMLQKSAEIISPEELYAVTGNQLMEINTAFQIMAIQEQQPELLSHADKLLLMPDLIAYFLTGNIAAERSIASTTQLYDQRAGDWAYDIAEKIGLRREMLPLIQDSGTLRGVLSQELQEELGLPEIPVYAVCGHDTQSAMAAIPAKESPFAFLSCGTWSLLGTALDAPVLSDEARIAGFTNEAGYGGKTAFLKNLTGLWIVQEARRQYAREGQELSFAEITELAKAAEPFRSQIDTEDARFAVDGDLPARIQEYCRETAQPVPETPGEIFRCICESLAIQYQKTLAALRSLTGADYQKLYVIGGGTQNQLLMQLTEEICKIPVCCCDAEGTALGNVMIQLGLLTSAQ